VYIVVLPTTTCLFQSLEGPGWRHTGQGGPCERSALGVRIMMAGPRLYSFRQGLTSGQNVYNGWKAFDRELIYRHEN
jgi:hypothetical protein